MEVQDADDVPVSAMINDKLEEAKTNESDSEDDIPVMELIKRRLAKKEKENKEKEREREREREREKRKRQQEEEDEKKSRKDKRKSIDDDAPEKSGRSFTSGSNTTANSFYQTDKGKIVQSLLVRWWYAYDWPLPEEIGTPPPGYEALDGFPGVFVSTRMDSLGNILDLRDKTKCPCLKNFAKESSAKLKDLCLEAFKNQIAVLESQEGNKMSKLILSLKAEMAEIRKIDPAKADKLAKGFETAFDKKVKSNP